MKIKARPVQRVRQVQELLGALELNRYDVEVACDLVDVPTLRVHPGCMLRGASKGTTLRFRPDADGVELTANNVLQRLTLLTSPTARAVFISSAGSEPQRGSFELVDLRATGQFSFIFEQARIDVIGISRCEVMRANVVNRKDTLSGHGVTCLQGAVTIWNRCRDNHLTEVSIDALRIGAVETPVQGGGLFLAGHGGEHGGTVHARRIGVCGSYIDSTLGESAEGTICAGVFIFPGARVDHVECAGDYVTIGRNAVSIDNWGDVEGWTVHGNVCTHGPNAVAIVNAGRLGRLEVRGRVDTHGDGARGCVIYGPTGVVQLEDVTTRGMGATGIHVCERLERLKISGGITVLGTRGPAMVKGGAQEFYADALHVDASGQLGSLELSSARVTDPAAQVMRNDSHP